MKLNKKVFICSIVLLVFVGFVSLVYDFWQGGIEAERFGRLAYEAELRLGFDLYQVPKHERLWREMEPDADNIIGFSTEGTAFGEAGFKGGDQTVLSQTELFGRIFFNQNSEITIPVIRDGERMEISVFIPTLELSSDPRELRRYKKWKVVE